jgi:hypothetical protein
VAIGSVRNWDGGLSSANLVLVSSRFCRQEAGARLGRGFGPERLISPCGAVKFS